MTVNLKEHKQDMDEYKNLCNKQHTTVTKELFVQLYLDKIYVTVSARYQTWSFPDPFRFALDCSQTWLVQI